MSKSFTISINWKGKDLQLSCNIYYESAQIQRIKISYNDHSFSMQNNYPAIKSSPTNKRPSMQWKIISGSPKDARFLQDVMHELEYLIKIEDTPIRTHPKNDQAIREREYEQKLQDQKKAKHKDHHDEDPWKGK